MLGAYLACRLALADSLPSVGGQGRYTFTLSALTIARNLVQLLGVAVLPIDTLALLGRPRSILLGGATAAMGFPIVAFSAWLWIRIRTPGRTFWALVSVVCVAGPHLIIPHVSEMYAHPVIAVMVLLVAPLFDQLAPTRRYLLASVACLLIGTAVSNAHKLGAMIASGERARTIGRRIAGTYPAPVPLVCSVPFLATETGYSVFQIPPGAASGSGKAVLQEWGWPPGVEFVRLPSVEGCRALHAELVLKFTGAETFETFSR
jgi:hypothetical protein